MTFIQTYTGRKYDFLDPQIDQICIQDIAHALCQVPRFGGHCKEFYSVAKHSMLVALLVPNKFKLEALLHDATEAYMGDMVNPLKNLIPQYRELEQKCHNAIANKFDIPYTISEEVKDADRHALYLESKYLLDNPPIEDWHKKFESKSIHQPRIDQEKFYSLINGGEGMLYLADVTEDRFLATFKKLFNQEFTEGE